MGTPPSLQRLDDCLVIEHKEVDSAVTGPLQPDCIPVNVPILTSIDCIDDGEILPT